ncbi:hypothetical protein LSTR_LSTR017452 [Laodelphax striatellus]|uniref:Uncharacterized protein n=1 Tax=Laodelphax striatellus TaxID=195883 RepID=A0A482XCA1_LAOST|nr:hypothetical protein LSTR_LSTR017452 [Laodelphax striatellus]
MPEIKTEPVEVSEGEGEEEREEQPPVRSFQAPQKQVKKLKLDIRSANTLAAGAAGLTPSTAVLAESLDTPDVLKPLLEGMDNPSFDLIKYCELKY